MAKSEKAHSCEKLHNILKKAKTFDFDFDGIYILFEKDEKGHGVDRIVRIGSHTGENRLFNRVKEHIAKNINRSIFRKNIGRVLLNKRQDEDCLKIWNKNTTRKADREKYSKDIDKEREAVEKKISKLEECISKDIKKRFYFKLIKVECSVYRSSLEKRLIATVAQCEDCSASENWLGKDSPEKKIVEKGLWQVQGLKGETLNDEDLEYIAQNLF
ncbi:MAG: hypothetical protein FWB72_00605 [Firmicutes bacterium]|nr:hypothetical protein [Bacillota bacterium]